MGVRGYGRRFYDLIKDSEYCNIVACLHKDNSVAEDAARCMGGSAFTDAKAFFSNDKMDAVILTVPNEYHYFYALEGMSAGKHILVEKPVTNTLDEAEKLLIGAQQSGLILMVGHDFRQNGFITRMKSEIDKGTIGEIVAAEFNLSHGGGLKFGPDKWRFHRDKCPGGPLNMLGTHLIDASNYLFGKVIDVRGRVKSLYARTTSEDMSLIQLEYESGVVSNIVTLYNSVSTQFINIYGTEGALRFSNLPEPKLCFQAKDTNCSVTPYVELAFENVNAQKVIFENFVTAILNEDSELENLSEAIEVVRVMEQALNQQPKASKSI